MKIRLCARRKPFIDERTETAQNEKDPISCRPVSQIAGPEQKDFSAMLNRIRKKVMKRILKS